jgi:hypothetical protein
MRKFAVHAVSVVAVCIVASSAAAAPATPGRATAPTAKKAVTPGFYDGRTFGYFDFGLSSSSRATSSLRYGRSRTARPGSTTSSIPFPVSRITRRCGSSTWSPSRAVLRPTS